MSGYIEGPANEPWECVDNPWAGRHEPIWWVQRRGYSERGLGDDDPYEWRFGSTTDCGDMEPQELAARLNELDRARADREALMEGLGLDPSDECRDEYPLHILKAAGYGERMKSERLEQELDRARALIAAIDTHLDSPSWSHELISADDGLLVECQGQDVLRAMLEDWRAGR